MMYFCPTFITERKKSAVGLLSFTRDLKSLNKEIARSTCDVIDGSQFIFVRWITELNFFIPFAYPKVPCNIRNRDTSDLLRSYNHPQEYLGKLAGL